MLAFFRPEASSKVRTLSFSERVAYQRAIEDVYWRHRIWPKERRDPKPALDAVMSQAQLEKKVTEYLRNSQSLEDNWRQPITAEQLQAEMDRMAKNTKQPEVLRGVFEALDNDPFVIAECLARPVLSEHLKLAAVQSRNEPLNSRVGAETQIPKLRVAASDSYTLPALLNGPDGCTDDTWTATTTNNAAGIRAQHTAVWTGSEMIVWGGEEANGRLNTGGRYNPGTDGWTATSTTNAPTAREVHTAVWTSSEMIVWGGYNPPGFFDTGGRYCAQLPAPSPTPTTTPTATATPSATPRVTPTPRARPTPVSRP